MAANARVLDRRRFGQLISGGPASAVRDAIAAYRNPDGGFGNALEPDTRCPDSQPLTIAFALSLMIESGAWDAELAGAACDWLAAHAPAEGGAVFIEASSKDWPHAPWMVPEDGDPASLISTGLLAGSLHAAGTTHPWLDRATELLWSRIDSMTTTSPYDMRALLLFLDHVPDRDRAHAAAGRIGPMIFDQDLVALDPATEGEVHFPLDFAPLPGSVARPLFAAADIEANLDHLAGAQLEDGGWTFNWMAWSPAAALEWRGHMTVDALRVLRANGRL